MNHSLTDILNIKYPIIQAPMAGGITTTELVVAVSNFGGLGSIGAGYMSAEKLKEQIGEIKSKTNKNFSVNLFVPNQFKVTEDEIERANQMLQSLQKELEVTDKLVQIPKYEEALKTFHQQVEVVLKENVPICSFTFGLPEMEIVSALKAEGIVVMATATTVQEAIQIENLGVDVVVAQGSEAGGHRGNFLNDTEDSLIGLMSLVPQVVDHVNIPVIAAGGIMDERGFKAALCLGAQAVQMGTAFLTTEESGAHPLYKKAILNTDESKTVLTKSFSGKYARGIRNKFIEQMNQAEDFILEFPVQNALTQPIRAQAQRKQNSEYMSLWSGQTPRLARSETVDELMRRLIET